ncbi:MAG: hypothetical protein H6567_06565 [Lewinellaceae bacterium]|nr:hypothetical protein [Lewinellaceae bacterium]
MKARFLFILLSLSYTLVSYGQISGIVFRDFNSNGVKNNTATFNEPFVSGVMVKAYNSAGTQVGSTTTNSSGAYSFTGLTLPLRIEFTGFQTTDYSSVKGSGSNTSVQFYSAASTTANFGINYPSDYSMDNPRIAVSCFVNGDNLVAGSSAAQGDALVAFNYETSNKTVIGTAGQVGAVWGEAYHRQSDKYFFASFGKRHSNWGPLGPNGIYVTTSGKTVAGTGNTSSFVNLQAVNPAFNAGSPVRDFSPGGGDKTQPNYDSNMVTAVGTSGLGDLDVSDDGQYLYTVNLNDRKVWRIEVGSTGTAPTSASQIVAYSSLPNPCTNSTFRPFALKYYRGEIYVGGVCDGVTDLTNPSSAVNRNNLKATVYKTNGSTAPGGAVWTQVFEMPLTFNRNANLNVGSAATASYPYTDPNGTNNALSISSWHPWARSWSDMILNFSDTKPYYPQPMLTDIEFDIDGSMILGFCDREGHQVGTQNLTPTGNPAEYGTAPGDILRVFNNNGTFVLENNGTAGTLTTGGSGNGDGPGGGEYYFQDRFQLGAGTYGASLDPSNHDENSLGGLALWPGSGEVVNSVFDPKDAWESGGVRWYSNSDGTVQDALTLYVAIDASAFGKAAGIGDPELATGTAPIEIGNRVWVDTDGDGIQDAGEAALSGVTVQLVKNGTVIATATTDATGNYYFSNGAGTSTSSAIYNITQLMANMQYIVRIPNVQGGSKQGALGTNTLTVANADATSNGDLRDSDGLLVGNNAEVTVLTTDIPIAGANNHTFDFGFTPAPTCTVGITCNPLPQTSCTPPNGSATTIVTGAQGNVTYLWSSGETTSSITGKAAGTYTVTVTDDFLPGCTATCQAVVANGTVNPTCSITVNSQPSCATLNGGSVTVVPSPAGTYSYVWNTGATTATVNNLTGGTYMVTVTNTSTSCTGVCQVTLDTPTNCCNINTITIQSLECLDNGTPSLMTDNRLRIGMVAYNSNTSLTTYNVSVNGGTTITPTSGTYGALTYFTLGPGTGGSGATYTLTLTDSVTSGCTSQIQVISPMDCVPATQCPTPECGTATIQVNI